MEAFAINYRSWADKDPHQRKRSVPTPRGGAFRLRREASPGLYLGGCSSKTSPRSVGRRRVVLVFDKIELVTATGRKKQYQASDQDG